MPNMRSTIKNALNHLRPDYMPFSFRAVYEYQKDAINAGKPNTNHLLFRLADVFLRTWDLGFTAFGGPPVHFQILYGRFVESKGGHAAWVDKQTVRIQTVPEFLMIRADVFSQYQELFAVSQALPGPASTKLLYSLVMYHAGLVCAIFAFVLWCLPGAIGMFLLSVGVAKIGETLPGPVYGLLSGLNASTVGIIALAAVQVSRLCFCFPSSVPCVPVP